MEKVQSRDQVTKFLFGQYPNEAGFHLTSDNQAFTEKHKGDALNHAKTLDDKTVHWVNNPKVKPEDEDSEGDTERADLIARYTELFSAAPEKNIKTETLKTKITEKEAEGN